MAATHAEPKACSTKEVQVCLDVLESLLRNPDQTWDRRPVEILAARITKKARKERRKLAEKRARTSDRALVENSTLCKADLEARATIQPRLPVAEAEDREVGKPRHCYTCKKAYRKLHFFYHQLCSDCAKVHYDQRHQRANLKGRRALITGGRIKIGFRTALKLLRDGAEVLVTTRFPRDAAVRFLDEPDAGQWKSRLEIHGLDLRDLKRVLHFADRLRREDKPLDILVHNACQTIRRPPEFYSHLLERELEAASALPTHVQALIAERTYRPMLADPQNDYPIQSIHEQRMLDRDGQPIDLRDRNSWVLHLDEVPPIELLEVFLINVQAPFILNGQLKCLMKKSEFPDRYIVNVSAMEGQFSRLNKTPYHPHTNMAKAALNMMTRTSAEAYAREGIYMNSVDTGWITQENPYPIKTRLRAQGFVPPLDEEDGAARIYDPIVRGNRGVPVYGKFLKDYVPTDW